MAMLLVPATLLSRPTLPRGSTFQTFRYLLQQFTQHLVGGTPLRDSFIVQDHTVAQRR
jgi:hypothetical protein